MLYPIWKGPKSEIYRIYNSELLEANKISIRVDNILLDDDVY